MKKVLLVEDENLIRRGLKFQMDWTAVNCVVAGEAASGQEGLEQIQNLQPDIVITDIRMPDMDGLEMLAAGQAECPFDAIIISGYSEFEYAQQAIHLGVSEYLLKPVDLNELRACLQKLVSRRQEGLANSEPSIPSITSVSYTHLDVYKRQVFDNVAFGLKNRKLPKEEIQKKVDAILKVVKIDHLKNRMPARCV